MNLGKWGEDKAAELLIQNGYEILERNFHTRWGEIDIIACNPQYIVFAEVKTRSNARYGTPSEAVTVSKQRKLVLTAQVWLQEHQSELQPRFDIIEVYSSGSVVHLTNAFEAEE